MGYLRSLTPFVNQREVDITLMVSIVDRSPSIEAGSSFVSIQRQWQLPVHSGSVDVTNADLTLDNG